MLEQTLRNGIGYGHRVLIFAGSATCTLCITRQSPHMLLPVFVIPRYCPTTWRTHDEKREKQNRSSLSGRRTTTSATPQKYPFLVLAHTHLQDMWETKSPTINETLRRKGSGGGRGGLVAFLYREFALKLPRIVNRNDHTATVMSPPPSGPTNMS